MLEHSDQQLIQGCLKGEQHSFKALYEKYQAYVYTICIRYGVSTQDVKDHMQVIFMEIFNALSRFDATKASFKTWITRITINQIVYQKRSKNIDYNVGDLNEFSTIDNGHAVSADWEIDQKELFAILNKMPAKYISAFNLSVIDGYTHSEIAAQLQIPESTSRVLVYRGRLWAMEQLQTHYKDAAPHFNSSNKTA